MDANKHSLTSIVDFPLGVLLHCLAKRILADKLKVLRGSVHLSPLHVCYNNKDIVAAVVVHAPEEHKFGELDQTSVPNNSRIWPMKRTIVNTTGIMESFRSCIER